VAVQKLRKKVLVDRALTAIEGGKFLLVIVDNDNVVAQISKARTRDQSNVS
jgi:hypothetical protein